MTEQRIQGLDHVKSETERADAAEARVKEFEACPQWWIYQRPDRTCFVERAFVEKGPAMGERIIATSFHETDAQAIMQAINSADAAEAALATAREQIRALCEAINWAYREMGT